jgi:predicted nucleotidyltransferase
MPVNPYRQIFQALQDAGIRYLVVGGVAVNLHGYRRFTADFDIVLALDPENLEKMTSLMHRMGYIERLPVELKSFADADQLQRWIGEKGVTAYTFHSSKRDRLDIDILAGHSLHFERYEQCRTLIDIEGGLKVPVISLEDLIQMKREANRPEDLIDIDALLELKEL